MLRLFFMTMSTRTEKHFWDFFTKPTPPQPAGPLSSLPLFRQLSLFSSACFRQLSLIPRYLVSRVAWRRHRLCPALFFCGIGGLFVTEYAVLSLHSIRPLGAPIECAQTFQKPLFSPLFPAPLFAAAPEQYLPAPLFHSQYSIASTHSDPLLCERFPLLPESRPASITSVRRSVSAARLRAPVEKAAFHPLDKARALEFASTPELHRLLASASTAELPLLASTIPDGPQTAIAPPVTRLRKVQQALYQRHFLGSLCARFESGSAGPAAIGYDPEGGTSYGKYQIASRTGSMQRFIRFLRHRAPSLAHRLSQSGPSNTLATTGVMPREWKRIAGEYPSRFEQLQDEFIHNSYYTPTLREIRTRTGIDLSRHPRVIREVLWSMAVQHGPINCARMFKAAEDIAKLSPAHLYHQELLRQIYRVRRQRIQAFSHKAHVPSLLRRLNMEETLALSQLRLPPRHSYQAVLDHPRGS
ncbi:hypothetical protein SAMN02745702_01544 [Desulfobaculum bizertense DSM 18034]|uniref:Type VI secretion system spike protein VgrG3-like C-terminal domain-containing protein n=2 Tax=Desulfobaculum TaxID=1433996 RepID=A0A1T4W3U6_9BACT|nr:hypothetical protein SAMN02745702_01544 [Desulfobaculum bizertense DSM 18034]